jgi:hypothetical protein
VYELVKGRVTMDSIFNFRKSSVHENILSFCKKEVNSYGETLNQILKAIIAISEFIMAAANLEMSSEIKRSCLIESKKKGRTQLYIHLLLTQHRVLSLGLK